ncbi:methionyl-tRNA formyltransferase [Scenedesmus sp. NREL 46B-D3]|nr:methionyl-tRNA formyltransferase [Scenedesmus sp. NREL 46B-D3]
MQSMCAHSLRGCKLITAQCWRHQARRAVATQAAVNNAGTSKKRVVFMGTPEVAAIVLEELLLASQQQGASFEVAAVVSQPGKPKGRGNKGLPTPSPVEQLARQHNMPNEAILCPRSAKEPAFLEAMRAMQPDLAITAAYGNMLPTAFLNIPKHGVLNIHPSLLPQYRGAAPVQRAVQDGVATTGVSVAFTVLKCDAGPIYMQEEAAVLEDEQAPELLNRLFKQGAQLLVGNLERVWSGEAAQLAQQQDEAQATHAAKLAKEEAQLDFQQPARVLHNKVRAYAGWPGTFAVLKVSSSSSSSGSGDDANQQLQQQQHFQVKVLRSRVGDAAAEQVVKAAPAGQVVFADSGKRMLLPCADGSVLEVLQLQPPTKKAMEPKAFYNGLSGKQLTVSP